MNNKIYRNLLIISFSLVLLVLFIVSFLTYDMHRTYLEEEARSLYQLYRLRGGAGLELEGGRRISLVQEEAGKTRDYAYFYFPQEDYLVEIRLAQRSLASLVLSNMVVLVPIFLGLIIGLRLVAEKLAQSLMKPLRMATSSLENILDEEYINIDLVDEDFHDFIKNINLYKEKTSYYMLRLEESEQFRREFTANVSHELKTPLTSINGYAELIHSGMARQEDIGQLAGIILEEGGRLLELIDSIINLSRLDDQDLEFQFAPLNLYDLVEHNSLRLAPKMREKNLDFQLRGERDLFMEGNERMIQDLVFNLLDNGIKYNREGSYLEVDISREAGYLVLRVRDGGLGIGPEDLERIFERFYIVDKSRNRKNQSTGLGLSIVKHIVELHQGQLEVKSQLGQGTEFKIKFREVEA